jgi:hypothetical protein
MFNNHLKELAKNIEYRDLTIKIVDDLIESINNFINIELSDGIPNLFKKELKGELFQLKFFLRLIEFNSFSKRQSNSQI